MANTRERDITRNWGEMTQFNYPSGVNGELEYQLLDNLPWYYEYMKEYRPLGFKTYGFTYLTHYKLFAAQYRNVVPIIPDESCWNWSGIFRIDSTRAFEYMGAALTDFGKGQQLNWNKLPTSSDFNLIMLLAEIDESILSILSVFKDLSVGNFSYGVLPFVAEIKAVLEALKKVYFWDGRYEDTVPIEHTYVLTDPYGMTVNVILEGKFILNGVATYPSGIPINMVLDWIGFHPDLATVWDLIPLSFLVNYLIPVGKFLESFRQGGWVKAIYLDGFRSLKLHVTFEHTTGPGTTHFPSGFEYNWAPTMEYYSRSAFADVLAAPVWDYSHQPPDWGRVAKAFGTFGGRNVGFKR